jgi:hypothetical protein
MILIKYVLHGGSPNIHILLYRAVASSKSAVPHVVELICFKHFVSPAIINRHVVFGNADTLRKPAVVNAITIGRKSIWNRIDFLRPGK